MWASYLCRPSQSVRGCMAGARAVSTTAWRLVVCRALKPHH